MCEVQLCFLVCREVTGAHILLWLCWGCGGSTTNPICLLSTPQCFHPLWAFYTWLTSENTTPDINPTVQVPIRKQNTTKAPVNFFLLGTADLLLAKCFLLCANIRLQMPVRTREQFISSSLTFREVEVKVKPHERKQCVADFTALLKKCLFIILDGNFYNCLW